jgi:4-hydroxy-2-oxoheptanedioate aldolase
MFVKMPAFEVLDLIAAGSRFDFVIVDREHSQLSEDGALALLRHARALCLPALIRLPALDSAQVNRALEAGACGIQLSMVRRASQVRELVAAARYAPVGGRSVALSSPSGGYGARDLKGYIDDQEADPPLLVVQIETENTDDDLAEIFSAGADIAFIGAMDLAVGVEHDQGRLAARIDAIAAAAEASGTVVGGSGLTDTRIRYAADATDIALFRAACSDEPQPGTPPSGRLGNDVAQREFAPDLIRLRAELEALLVEFSHRLDIGCGATVDELFAEDGAYVLDGEELRGRERIRSGYARRAARGPRTARHLVSNVRVDPSDSEHARVSSVWVLYAADGEPVLASQVPLVVADIADQCVRSLDGEWLIQRRDLRTLFRSDSPVVTPGS